MRVTAPICRYLCGSWCDVISRWSMPAAFGTPFSWYRTRGFASVARCHRGSFGDMKIECLRHACCYAPCAIFADVTTGRIGTTQSCDNKRFCEPTNTSNEDSSSQHTSIPRWVWTAMMLDAAARMQPCAIYADEATGRVAEPNQALHPGSFTLSDGDTVSRV